MTYRSVRMSIWRHYVHYYDVIMFNSSPGLLYWQKQRQILWTRAFNPSRCCCEVANQTRVRIISKGSWKKGIPSQLQSLEPWNIIIYYVLLGWNSIYYNFGPASKRVGAHFALLIMLFSAIMVTLTTFCSHLLVSAKCQLWLFRAHKSDA